MQTIGASGTLICAQRMRVQERVMNRRMAILFGGWVAGTASAQTLDDLMKEFGKLPKPPIDATKKGASDDKTTRRESKRLWPSAPSGP